LFLNLIPEHNGKPAQNDDKFYHFPHDLMAIYGLYRKAHNPAVMLSWTVAKMGGASFPCASTLPFLRSEF
jgi:hypothetical protein